MNPTLDPEYWAMVEERERERRTRLARQMIRHQKALARRRKRKRGGPQ